jgi:hypothetical protein
MDTLHNGRAEFGREILGTLSHELSARFDAGFDPTNLSRMVSFARTFPDYERTTSLAHQLGWSHVRALLALKSDEARSFYAEETASKRLSVRELRAAISRKAYERREIANSQIPNAPPSPATPSATR